MQFRAPVKIFIVFGTMVAFVGRSAPEGAAVEGKAGAGLENSVGSRQRKDVSIGFETTTVPPALPPQGAAWNMRNVRENTVHNQPNRCYVVLGLSKDGDFCSAAVYLVSPEW
jgi:hypothetical protein